MDVDDPARQRIAHLSAEDLHIAGQHDEVGTGQVDEVEQLSLLVGSRVGGHRKVVKRHLVGTGERLKITVIGDHGSDVRRQITGRR